MAIVVVVVCLLLSVLRLLTIRISFPPFTRLACSFSHMFVCPMSCLVAFLNIHIAGGGCGGVAFDVRQQRRRSNAVRRNKFLFILQFHYGSLVCLLLVCSDSTRIELN